MLDLSNLFEHNTLEKHQTAVHHNYLANYY